MSDDDTPTERFDPGDAPTRRLPTPPPGGAAPGARGSDAPTERFSAPGPPPGGYPPVAGPPAGAGFPASAGSVTRTTTSGPPEKSGPSKGLIALIVVAALLLVALAVVLTLLLTRGEGTPSAVGSPTPSTTAESPSAEPSPSESPSEEPSEEPAPPPAPPATIEAFDVDESSVDCTEGGSVPLTFSWNTTGEQLWFGVGTDDARANPFDTYPLIYTLELPYQCGQPEGEQRYTISVLGEDGVLVSDTLTVAEESE